MCLDGAIALGTNDGVWAITTYFNPLKYKSRLRNYRTFRQHLDLPLCTVEQSTSCEYELGKDDADIRVTLFSKDVLWQKERLLNIALSQLPQEARIIVWVDCDVVFGQLNWHSELHDILNTFPLLQCYSHLVDLGEDQVLESAMVAQPATTRYSVAWLAHATGAVPDSMHLTNVDSLRAASSGLAWAARRELIQKHGFYDSMILGGGDRAFACACFGRFEDAISIAKMSPRRAQHYMKWACPLHSSVQGKVGVIEGPLFHLWHGSIRQRGYIARHEELERLGFDPSRDIQLAPSGAWEWSPCATGQLREAVVMHFRDRKEDGLEGMRQDR
jgi:hypothetical protein